MKPEHARPHVHGTEAPPGNRPTVEVTEEETRAAEDVLPLDILLMTLQAAETDEERLRYAAALHRRGDERGREALRELEESGDPDIRARAHAFLHEAGEDDSR